ncbi:hypothetical protein NUITMVS1_09440 [Shewanella xiamenensis]|nr:hypothetical protein NUITMVS1_09440 [Shewanella xiamenensis]
MNHLPDSQKVKSQAQSLTLAYRTHFITDSEKFAYKANTLTKHYKFKCAQLPQFKVRQIAEHQ